MDVLSWCNSNNLSLNVSKTKLVYFSSRHKQLSIKNGETSINLSDSKILPTSVAKNYQVSPFITLFARIIISIKYLKNVIPIYPCSQDLIYFVQEKKELYLTIKQNIIQYLITIILIMTNKLTDMIVDDSFYLGPRGHDRLTINAISYF